MNELIALVIFLKEGIRAGKGEKGREGKKKKCGGKEREGY